MLLTEIPNFIKCKKIYNLKNISFNKIYTNSTHVSKSSVFIIEKKTRLKTGTDYYLSYSPERIVEGNAMYEIENIPQIVSGYTENCLSKTLNFCKNFTKETV